MGPPTRHDQISPPQRQRDLGRGGEPKPILWPHPLGRPHIHQPPPLSIGDQEVRHVPHPASRGDDPKLTRLGHHVQHTKEIQHQ